MSGELPKPSPAAGMRTFLVVWAGQLVSVLGSGLTYFGVAIFVYVETESVTNLALIVLAGSLPAILVGPFAGTLVDRMERRVVMMAADSAAGLASLILALLWLSGRLEIWQIMVTSAVGSTANAFQQPAYLASLPLLVPKEHLNRANGLTQANEALSIVLTPLFAGVLIGRSRRGAGH